MYDHQITLFIVTVAPCRIWSNKIIFVLFLFCARDFGDYRVIQSPSDGRAAEPGGNSRFPFLVPNHTIIQDLHQLLNSSFHCFKSHSGRVLFALPSHLASIRVLYPTMLPARRNKVDISVRSSTYTIPVLAFLSFSLIEPC
jgi:hypothetical protein